MLHDRLLVVPDSEQEIGIAVVIFVADIAHAVAIEIRLVRIGDERAVIRGIGDVIAVVIIVTVLFFILRAAARSSAKKKKEAKPGPPPGPH